MKNITVNTHGDSAAMISDAQDQDCAEPGIKMTDLLVETQAVERDYGFDGTQAIIDTNNGRLLIKDGYGGVDTLAGGCVRWRHGAAYALQPGDTFKSMSAKFGTCYGKDVSILSAVFEQADEARPYLPYWSGDAIAAVARQLGI